LEFLTLTGLLARECLDDNICIGLPDDQWQREATLWFQSSLSKMQITQIQYAYKSDSYRNFTIPPENTTAVPAYNAELVSQCTSQKIQSSGRVQNFSFLGIMIVITSTVLLILGAAFLESCARLVRRRRGTLDSDRAIARTADYNLDLARMAMGGENQSKSGWIKSDNGVPITSTGARLNRPVKSLSGLPVYVYHPVEEQHTTSWDTLGDAPFQSNNVQAKAANITEGDLSRDTDVGRNEDMESEADNHYDESRQTGYDFQDLEQS
jgi:hypothetical protein